MGIAHNTASASVNIIPIRFELSRFIGGIKPNAFFFMSVAIMATDANIVFLYVKRYRKL